MTIKNTLLGIGLVLCGLFAIERIVHVYGMYVPLAAEGECLAETSGSRGKFLITENRISDGEADGMIVLNIEGQYMYIPSTISFEDLRRYKMKKVECHEKTL